MSDSEPPNTEREPVTLDAIMFKLCQIETVVMSLSGAVVELNKTLTRHLTSHELDSHRDPKQHSNGGGNGDARQ
jgi:hypothetical protein